MWQSIRADMIFKGNRFKIAGDNHLTFTALEEPVIKATSVGDITTIKCRMSGKNSTKLMRFRYDDLVQIWNEAR